MQKNKLYLFLLGIISICFLKIAFWGVDVKISNRNINVSGNVSVLDIRGSIDVSGNSDAFSKPIEVTIRR